jgi:hypothetical protein
MSTRKSLCKVNGVAGVAFDAAVHDLKPGDLQFVLKLIARQGMRVPGIAETIPQAPNRSLRP